MFRTFISAFIVILLVGCSTAPSFPISRENKAAIHAIKIDKNISAPQKIDYVGRGDEIAANFGLIGGIAGGIAAEIKAEKIQSFVAANNIHIEQIVRNQFIQQISKDENLKITEENPDALMQIVITQYGLFAPSPASKNLAPSLSVQAFLVRQNKIVWQASADTLHADEITSYKADAILHNPQLLAKAWDLAAAEVVDEILKTLQ